MSRIRTTFSIAVTALVAAALVGPSTASAQDRTASVVGFGGMGVNTFSTTQLDFGANVGMELTPSVQVIGEFGRIGDTLPTLSAGLLDLTSYNVRVSALYGEGGLRLLAAPDSAVNPYVEATAGIARLTPHVSGFGSADVLTAAGLQFLRGTDPLIGFGGGILLRGGPLVADVGYRYKQVVGADSLASLLSAGQPLRSHQVRFGIGVRF